MVPEPVEGSVPEPVEGSVPEPVEGLVFNSSNKLKMSPQF